MTQAVVARLLADGKRDKERHEKERDKLKTGIAKASVDLEKAQAMIQKVRDSGYDWVVD